VETEIADKWH